jgi:hypothetical protein
LAELLAEVMALRPKTRRPQIPPMMRKAMMNRLRLAVASGEFVMTFRLGGGG